MQNTNKLLRLEEFQATLKDYQPSEESLQLLHETNLVILVGPTAAGRNTLINLLLKTGRYHFIITDTTRRPRINNGIMEQNGVEYWFKPEEEVLSGLQNGEYVEAALIHNQQVSGAHIQEIITAHKADQIAITEVSQHGGEAYYAMKQDTLVVFLMPPTFDVWMQRLRGRGEMDEDEVRRRMVSATEEITAALGADYYHFVINNEIGEAAMAVDELANGRSPDNEKQLAGRDHAEQLAIDIRLYLEQGV